MPAKSTPSKPSSSGGSGFKSLPPQVKRTKKDESTKRQPNSPVFSGKTKGKGVPRNTQGIPDIVSKRMIKRMIVFSGIPTLFGLTTFPICYFMIRQGFALPNVAVLLVSLGFLGLGVLGLSYGVLSASWEESSVGSVLGLQEFKLNFGRLLESWKDARAQSLQK